MMFKRYWKPFLTALLTSLPLLSWAGTFNTYAAWSDRAGVNRGRIYVYSGANPVNVQIFNADTANTEINNLIVGPVAAGPYQPVAEHFITMVGNHQYFRLQTDELIVWEIEENIQASNHGDDSHDFLAAADTGRYRGGVFMTYMRDDEADVDPLYGDLAAIINPPDATGPITVTVSKWTGVPPLGSWSATVSTSAAIPAGSIWMWSPSQQSNFTGGTEGLDQGHYKFEVTGGEGILYKGNSFIKYSGGDCTPPVGACTAGTERDNLLLFGVDVITGKKIGTNLLGAADIITTSPHIVVSNGGSNPVDFEIQHYQPTLAPVQNYAAGTWPMDSSAPGGTWVTVDTQLGLAVDKSYYFDNNPNSGYGIAGFFRVVSTNGELLSAAFGAGLIGSQWCDGDYLFASDTQRAFGRKFVFGGEYTQNQLVEVHAIAVSAGTSITLETRRNFDGALHYTTTATATQQRSGHVLSIPVSSLTGGTDYTTTITSSGLIYAYVMSANTGSDGGETFFSVPPPIDPFFTVSKSVNKSVAQLGETLTYVLTGENPGFGAVNSTKIWDTLPANVSLVSAQPPPDISSPPYYAWTSLGSLNSGSQLNVTLAVRVDSGSHLDVVSNNATGSSDITTDYVSGDANFTILAPGPEMQKSASVASANVGETYNYTITYADQRPLLPDPIDGLDLKIRTNGVHDVAQMRYYFEITNNTGGGINIGDLDICYWYNDSSPAASFQFANDWGGDTSPWDGWNGPGWTGSATAITAMTQPANRQANLRFCWNNTGTNTLSDGVSLTNINLRIYLNSPQQYDNHFDDYTQDVASGTYVSDHHFALYYQGQLVTERTLPATADPDTGCPPFYLQVQDTLNGGLDYISSNPPGTLVGNTLTWVEDCVRPAELKNYIIQVAVNPSAIPGSSIPNTGNYEISTGPGISVPVNVSILGSTYTPSYTPTQAGTYTATPTISPTPTYSFTPTVSLTATPSTTVTVTPSFTYTPTAPPSATHTSTLTPTPGPLILHPNPPSPNPGSDKGIWISYFISTDAEVVIEIWTVAGERVRSLDPVFKYQGNNEQFWDAFNDSFAKVSTGIYIFRITARSPKGEEESVFGKLAIVR